LIFGQVFRYGGTFEIFKKRGCYRKHGISVARASVAHAKSYFLEAWLYQFYKKYWASSIQAHLQV